MSLPIAPVDVLAIEDLWLSIGDGAPVLRGVGLRIGAGEVHGLVGESGAGKSISGAVCWACCRAAPSCTRAMSATVAPVCCG